jgi:alpha-L-fucosidase
LEEDATLMAKRKTKRTKREARKAGRLRWFQEARFGMFIHWGLYAQLGRGEWVMNRESIPREEYETLAETWTPAKNAARRWARLARQAGMKYAVMTTKHHDGFCLWDTEMTEYNAVCHGPGRDLVAEFVEACRKEDLRVGLYYSLLDWHHPDGQRCAKDSLARTRFLDFTQGCVRELMSNYGPIDILWYDGPRPLPTAEAWESRKMNRMVRRLQPEILINNRSRLDEDFGTPEGEVIPQERAWEACMTFNGDWGYAATPAGDWQSVRDVLRMLRTAAAYRGNLLLNIGPTPDGEVPEPAAERLQAIGKWVKKNGEALYGLTDRIDDRLARWLNTGFWTLKGKVAYLWLLRGYPGETFAVGGIRTHCNRISWLHNDKPVKFKQEKHRLVLKGLPRRNPDRTTETPVLRFEFASAPRQML